MRGKRDNSQKRSNQADFELLELSSTPEIVVQDEKGRSGEVRKTNETANEDFAVVEPSIVAAPDGILKQRQFTHVKSEAGLWNLEEQQAGDTISPGADQESRPNPPKHTFGSALKSHLDFSVRQATSWYKAYVRYGLFHQRKILSSKDGRRIDLAASRRAPLIDERTGHEYISNRIRSSRYTIWNFLPYQIWFQFTKAANFYFLIIGICQLIPGLSTTGSFTTIVPLLLFLSFSIAREGYDDIRRYRLDAVENKRLATVLERCKGSAKLGQSKSSFAETMLKNWTTFKKRVISVVSRKSRNSTNNDAEPSSSPWMTVKWINLKVGDIIKLKRDEQVPADIILLQTDGQNGMAYTETMALDGETNLKSKGPPHMMAKGYEDLNHVLDCNAQFVFEDPNLDLYDFNGRVTVNGQTLPLTQNNVIYRGSTLRNTASAIGMIINTGEECKIRMNASKNPKAKAPALQMETNKAVIVLAVFVVLLAVGCTVGYVIWQKVFESNAWYLEGAQIWLVDIFIAFAIEFNNLIPLALYVSLEIVKVSQYLLLRDIEMYDPVSDTPMVSNTQTIFENLGQINYIFSDKTGTLTENSMQFRKMSVAGTAWLCEDSNSKINARHNIEQEAIPETAKNGMSKVTALPVMKNKMLDPEQTLPSFTSKSGLDASPMFPGQLSTDELLNYLQHNSGTAFAKKVKLFILSIAICHTCLPELEADGEIHYQAASPDEVALVNAAKDFGYIVVDRTTKSLTIRTFPSGSADHVQETYEILNIIEFSSTRKRMSIIVRFPDGKICLFCKGADSVIQPRLRLASVAAQEASKIAIQDDQRMSLEVQQILMRLSGEQEPRSSLQRLSLQRPSLQRASFTFDRTGMMKKSTDLNRKSTTTSRITSFDIKHRSPLKIVLDDAERLNDAGVFERCFQHVNDFASEGLRILLYGYRFIERDEYSQWKEIYHQAETSLCKRQDMIESAAELIEVDIELTGATAIEDKLQKGVPETIEKLQKANIKIWMLTGDKRETAINVAHAALICKSYSDVIILDEKRCQTQLASTLLNITEKRIAHSVIVVEGKTLGWIENNDSLTAMFSDLLVIVDCVIVCRASPSQKAEMIKKIRQRVPNSMTLAIGDGGNDIAMIQEAHVGVGISGKEGLQAARVADYSIAQFRFLQRLLFVHGHWNYSRTADYIVYTFWKEMMFYCVQIMYQRWNGYTGPSFYETTGLTVWNTLFSSLCVMLPAIFEQDLKASTLLAVPELYSYGQEKGGFNMKLYTWWMIVAVIQSQIIWWMIYGLYGTINVMDDQGLFALGNLAFSVVVVFINLKLLVYHNHYKTWIPIFGASLTIGGWWAWNLFLSAIIANTPGPYTVYKGFTQHFGKNLSWWAVFVAVLTALIIPDLVFEALQRKYWPSMIQRWQELEQDKEVMDKVEEVGGDGIIL